MGEELLNEILEAQSQSDQLPSGSNLWTQGLHDQNTSKRREKRSARDGAELSVQEIREGSCHGGFLLFPSEGSKSFPYDGTHRQ